MGEASPSWEVLSWWLLEYYSQRRPCRTSMAGSSARVRLRAASAELLPPHPLQLLRQQEHPWMATAEE